MVVCYILYSKSLDKYYIGFTQESILSRLEKHNSSYYDKTFTGIALDWSVYLVILCNTVSQGVRIEKHIKKMKSRVYIENLLRYPEMIEKLLQKFI
ncbi:GIY-YIG nuclease family protein [Flavobacterium sp.]|uniref:GIY-YIG nuclease family protein n=1 Tax=Flavobacterium sp. TaxID=239 RepID=UPI00286E0175|nr:GIY-YIG nuclease family protein [Flavobacterium sp.]